MFSQSDPNPLRASLMLLLATVCWGCSFVLMTALALHQSSLVPGAGSWFFTSYANVLRFGAAALLLGLWAHRSLRRLTRLELWQGLGLAVFGGMGLLLQMDGVQHTKASTAAFLTQCYCLFIPLWVACHKRQWPTKIVALSSAMVLVGVGVLADVNWRELHLGRGETETLLASLLFTGQILWLERPKFARNNCLNATFVMFAISALLALPICLLTTPFLSSLVRAYASPSALAILLVLIVLSTLVAYLLMNYWQPHVSATQAGLIYCAEPLFTSLFSLFLPGLLSTWMVIRYPNEHLTPELLVGGGLITTANVLIILRASKP